MLPVMQQRGYLKYFDFSWGLGVRIAMALTCSTMLLTGCESTEQSPVTQGEVVHAEGSGDIASDAAKDDHWQWPRLFKGGSLGEQLGLEEATWSPEPIAVHIAPSTRFILEDNEPILDAAIELIDDLGDSTKAAGLVRFELFEAQSKQDSDIVATERRLYAWDIELLTQRQQQVYYNPILRGYNFRLGVDDIRIRNMPTILLVSFETASGNRLQARESLSQDW